MAKTAIHEQGQALSVYFRDMLAEPEKKQPANEPVAITEDIGPDATALVENPPVETTPTETVIPEADHQENFLLCEIGGMPLAIAVSALNNIVHWPAQGLNQLLSRSDWQLGLLSNRNQHCDVLDIRSLLQAPDTAQEQQADYILLLDQGRRGIACHAIEQIRSIRADAINWRQDRSQRPWFLGVISDSMHSIVDINALLAALDNGEMA